MADPVAVTLPPSATPGRIQAIDALRGFDMFWIMGGDVGHWLVTSATVLVLGHMPKEVAYQLNHHWGVFTVWDMIMPLFLFIVGAAIPFSIGRRLENNAGRGAIYAKALYRVVLLWILGMVAQGNLLQAKWDDVKFFSNTLQAIAVGYLIATVTLVELRQVRWQAAVCGALLLVYWLVFALVPRPGGHAGDFSPEGNVAIWIDHALLGSHQDGTPYAWILGSLGFGATTLLGVLAGHLLRSSLSGPRKVAILVAAGVASLALGWTWSWWLPIIKHLWTPSMVLWAGGWSLLLLAAFYGAIDVLDFKRWAFPFQVIGANAIVAYMLEPLLDFGTIPRHIFGGLCAHTGRADDFALAFFTLLTVWGFLYFLYRNRIFIRV
ncbi:MAG: acyltransferase family protein [Thermoguttaceae bacterium]